ncbi:MAG: DNA-3-methyladenine glycosylase 2 family protein, partial [Mycobacterium sp.]
MSVTVIECSVEFPGPASPGFTLSPQRRGGGDPCYLTTPDGAIWRTSSMRTGPVTARITRSGPRSIGCEAWGSGAKEFADGFPALLGADDDASGFSPVDPTIAEAYRRVPHLRLGRTGRVLEALIPAVIEQRVAGKDAFRAWRLLVTKYGSPAPGPAPARMRVP